MNLSSRSLKIVAFQYNSLCLQLCYSLRMAISDVAGKWVYGVIIIIIIKSERHDNVIV